MSDPRLKHMTRVRWLWEAWQLKLKEDAEVTRINKTGEQSFKAFRDILCSILGTNLEPITQSDGTVRWPTEGEFTPLIYAIARPDYLKSAMEKINNLVAGQSGPDPVDPEAEGGYTEDDLQFFDELPVDTKKAFWDSPEMKSQLRQLVIQKDPRTVNPYDKKQPKPLGLDAEFVKQMQEEDENFGRKKKARMELLEEDDIDFPPGFGMK
jgi:hypothetical protein